MIYNKEAVSRLVDVIVSNDGINNKAALADMVKQQFNLALDRKVYYGKDFAIRFSRSATRNMGNTVLSLSALREYDDRPFFVCIVTPDKNYLQIANTTFLKKISHSSHQLRVDNIKGSFNGSDIMKTISELDNSPENFEELFAMHQGFTFEENLERLVEATNSIAGTGRKYLTSKEQIQVLMDAPRRAEEFLQSDCFRDLSDDLKRRTQAVQNEIAMASFIDNVNIRGRVIEYLISSDSGSLRETIIDSLRNRKPIPEFKTDYKLGDYSKEYPNYITETDIKTKVLALNSNPKAYNIDKFLEFLSHDKTVYLIYLVGIDKDGRITSRLCPVFQDQLRTSTNIIHHWAGRNSRGVVQFVGNGPNDILYDYSDELSIEASKDYLMELLSL